MYILICERVQISGVSRVWLVPLAPLLRGRKIVWEKLKCVSYSFLNLCFSPQATIRLQSCINTAPSSNVLSRAYCAGTTMHYDKTLVLCTSQQSEIVTEQEHSLVMSTTSRSSHAIRKAGLVVLLSFRQEDTVPVRIWLRCV